ncbi:MULTISPECIES: hypothetical protein [unclassified Pedobacter]|uniref:hypothetical protein n=1 Tax=unclassified Pedobacter TaxID=2628915 RepID=UPI00141FA775|nr:MULTISPECIES: hypothetical protein [unclassified Pedobacter]NII82149.1 putative membrane protein [Pedobacter sp. SG908]NMN36167.1 putative membrane protein [Pedobacter sp. SG918]
MIYNIVLFIHISGVLLLFAGLGVEWICILKLSNAATNEQIKEAVTIYTKLSIAGIGAAMTLLSGIYMAATVWEGTSWVISGLIGFFLIALTSGSFTEKRMKSAKKIIKNADGNLIGFFGNTNKLRLSIWLRTSILFGIVFLMTVKPDPVYCTIILLTSVGVGVILSKKVSLLINKV